MWNPSLPSLPFTVVGVEQQRETEMLLVRRAGTSYVGVMWYGIVSAAARKLFEDVPAPSYHILLLNSMRYYYSYSLFIVHSY